VGEERNTCLAPQRGGAPPCTPAPKRALTAPLPRTLPPLCPQRWVLRYGALFNSPLVHHAIVYQCAPDAVAKVLKLTQGGKDQGERGGKGERAAGLRLLPGAGAAPSPTRSLHPLLRLTARHPTTHPGRPL
jgi:hypothetical protein